MQTYFASDFHLGLNIDSSPLEREKRVVAWLEEIALDAKEIYLLGDIFDFWWEYRNVVPKGFTRFLGTVARITDSGIPIHFFTGNHDMWIGDYLSKECGMTIHTKPLITNIDGKRFFIAHGDGLGNTSLGFKLLLKCFHSKLLCSLYSTIHPVIGVGIGHLWSKSSRLGKGISTEYKGDDKEEFVNFANSYLTDSHIDYFILGHRHIAITRPIKHSSKLIILGDWVQNSNWAVWNGKEIEQIIKPLHSNS